MKENIVNLNKLCFRFAGYCFNYENICRTIDIIKSILFIDDEVSFLLKKSPKKIEKAFNNKILGKKIYGNIKLEIDSKESEEEIFTDVYTKELFSNDYFDIRNQFDVSNANGILEYIDYIKDLDKDNMGIPEKNDDIYFNYYYNFNDNKIYETELVFYIYGHAIDYKYEKYINIIDDVIDKLINIIDIKSIYFDVENGCEDTLRRDVFEFSENDEGLLNIKDNICDIGYINIIPEKLYDKIKSKVSNNYDVKKTPFNSVLIKSKKAILDFTMNDRNIMTKDFIEILEPRGAVLDLCEIRSEWEHLSLYNCEFDFIKPRGGYCFSEKYSLKELSKIIEIKQYCPYQIMINFNEYNGSWGSNYKEKVKIGNKFNL